MVDGFVLSAHQKAGKGGRTRQADLPAAGLHTKHQRSKTLMRKAVKKPSSLLIVKDNRLGARPQGMNPKRELRAKTVAKHSKVSRFGFLPNSSRPAATAVVQARPRNRAEKSQLVSAAPRTPSMVTSVSHQKLERLLDEALLKADAHKQMMKKGRPGSLAFRRFPRWVVIALTVLVLSIAAAILIWENLPAVAVKVAAARAHVKASMPAYTPSGYSFANPINYKPGSVTLHYIDKVGSSSGFLLTQKTSNWDSQSLANSLPKDAPVQTFETDGTSVYMYGQAQNATWVNHGVLYNLQNKSNLTSDQVMKIVDSL